MIDESELCIHDIYPISSCTRCNGRDAKAEKLQATITGWFASQFAGECDWCTRDYDEGDIVGRTRGSQIICDAHR